jgi:hypothetical protein
MESCALSVPKSRVVPLAGPVSRRGRRAHHRLHAENARRHGFIDAIVTSTMPTRDVVGTSCSWTANQSRLACGAVNPGHKPGADVKKAGEFKQNAKTCRNLAKRMEVDEYEEQLLAMADAWEVLANERQRTASVGDVAGNDEPWMTAVVKN